MSTAMPSGRSTVASVSSPSAQPATAPGSDSTTTASTLGSDLGLLILRLAVGLTVAVHGAQKLFGWFQGDGLTGTGLFFEAVGYPAGKTMALIAGLSEALGGLGLALGLLTPLAGAAVLGTMLNAFVAVHWPGGFYVAEGVEFVMVLGSAAAAVTLAGPGRYAVDRLLPVPALRTPRFALGAGAVAFGLVTAVIVLLLRGR